MTKSLACRIILAWLKFRDHGRAVVMLASGCKFVPHVGVEALVYCTNIPS